jgi:heme/copper-type cytochrome/quinol oxidase subunit 1
MDFEQLFWGGGHILQFANTIAMIVAWFYLVRFAGARFPLGGNACAALFFVFLAFVLPSPLIHLFYDISSYEYRDFYTQLMRWGIGPPAVIFMAITVYSLRGLKIRGPAFSSLVLSMASFVVGGAIGFDIGESSTKIPAHYHSSIGAVTIAFMGLFYEVLPLLGAKVYSDRMARIQPYVYTAGVFLFSAGLYTAGIFGVGRKLYGGEQALDTAWKFIGMGVMGAGGLIAIAGGILFVANGLASLLGRR